MISVNVEHIDAAAVLRELVNSLTAVNAYVEALRSGRSALAPEQLTSTIDKTAAQCRRAGAAVERLQLVMGDQDT